MIDEIKRIGLEELNNRKAQYKEKESTIKQGLNVLKGELSSLYSEKTRGLTVRGDFSFLERWLTRRKDYKKFKAQSKRFYELPELISKLESEIAEESKRVDQEIETSGIRAGFDDIDRKMEMIQRARTLYEMGTTPIKAMKFLERRGIQPVLSKSDKHISSHPKDYSSKSSLIGVHKTEFEPTNNMIKSSRDSNVEYKKSVTINGIEYEYSYKSERDTVHMAMNDEVLSHFNGSWDDCKSTCIRI